MRGSLLALTALLVVPFAMADSVNATDPYRDERTLATTQSFADGIPVLLECHDAGSDVAAITLERGATVRATYSFYGQLALPSLNCNDQPLAPTERMWEIRLSGGPLSFSATATAGPTGAPAAPCLRANHPLLGNSASCLTQVHVEESSFWFEVPTTGTIQYEGGPTGPYSFATEASARTSSYSRATVGSGQALTLLYGVFDFGVGAFSS